MTEEQYQAIEDCGAAEMLVSETCEIVEITETDFYGDPEAVRRFHKGQLLSKLKIRQAVVRMAREGVPQMVKLYQDFTKETGLSFTKDDDPAAQDGQPQQDVELDMSAFGEIPKPDEAGGDE
jgi:hypothetical protein